MRKTITLLLSVLVLGAASYAQTISGSIAGSVVDPSHAPIPNAQVTARELEQKFVLTAKTDDAGHFVFPQISPGTYSIMVEAKGFKTYENPGIPLNANDKLTIGELVMQVGTLAERIEVSTAIVQRCSPASRASAALRS